MAELKVINLNDLIGGKVSQEAARAALANWDTSEFKDCDVHLRGCAPTWAHLMVAGKLFALVQSITFVIDDGKDGLNVPVYARS